MPDPVPLRDLVRRHRRRLYAYLRALLPAATEAEAAFRETVERITQQAKRAPATKFADWAEGIARQVAAARRRAISPPPFSDDLFRQLADSAGPVLDRAEERPAVLAAVLDRLPPPERELIRRKYALGLVAEQIAVAEGRPPAVIARDLTLLHASLESAVREALPDHAPPPPGGAADLGRLVDQLLDGTLTADGRLVLETLLLADAAAQAHYHRHVGLASELTWTFRGEPELPAVPATVRRVSAREWAVTVAFLLACVAALAFAGWVIRELFSE